MRGKHHWFDIINSMDDNSIEKFKQRQTQDWNTWASQWKLFTEPFRPSKQDMSIYASLINAHIQAINNPTIVILGSTPELRDLCIAYSLQYDARILCVEMMKDIYYAFKQLMNTDNQNEQLIEKNWLNMNLPEKSVDIVVGDLTDGNINHEFKSMYYKQIHKSLKETGMYIARTALYKSQDIINPILTSDQISKQFKIYLSYILLGKISILQAANWLAGELALYSYYKNSNKKLSLSFYEKELIEMKKENQSDKLSIKILDVLNQVLNPIKDKIWDYTSWDETMERLSEYFNNIQYEYSHDYPASNTVPILSMTRK